MENVLALLAKSNNPVYEGELFLPSQNLLANEDFREVAESPFIWICSKSARAIKGIWQSIAFKRRLQLTSPITLVKTSDFKAEEWSDTKLSVISKTYHNSLTITRSLNTQLKGSLVVLEEGQLVLKCSHLNSQLANS